MAISEDGNRTISFSDNCYVRLWDILSGEAIGIPLRRHERPVTFTAMSRDGKIFQSGSSDCTIREYDAPAERKVIKQHLLLTSPDEVRSYPARKPILSISMCASGKLMVPVSEAITVQRWDMLTGEAVG